MEDVKNVKNTMGDQDINLFLKKLRLWSIIGWGVGWGLRAFAAYTVDPVDDIVLPV